MSHQFMPASGGDTLQTDFVGDGRKHDRERQRYEEPVER
jgi:hypothetical protein